MWLRHLSTSRSPRHSLKQNEWSMPLPILRCGEVIRTADPGDVMRLLTKRISPPV